MGVPSPMRIATLALLVGGLACAKNRTDETVGAARDTTAAGISDSAKANQSKSGVTDTKTGESTLGKDATKTRPDQGQPVTSKGDTINAAVDSSTTAPGAGVTTTPSTDSSAARTGADSSSMKMSHDSSTMNMSHDSATMNMSHDSATMNMGPDSSTMRMGADSSSTNR
jgi:hypothetical protein